MVKDRLFRVIALKQSYINPSCFAWAILAISGKKSILTEPAIRPFINNPPNANHYLLSVR